MFRTPATSHFVLTTLATASLLLTQTPVANAHPGHGSPSAQTGLQHYLTSPLHAGPVLLVAAIVAVGVWLAVRFQRSKSDD
jgi:hydrogenase/urease accessory protein HupE